MGGKKGNSQKEEAARQKAMAKADEEEKAKAAEWKKGSKDDSKKQAAAEKKAEQAAKKAEAKALLEQEEASQPAKGKGANKKVAEKKTRGLDLSQLDSDDTKPSALNATGIDNALDALSLTASKNDMMLDRHPERRKEAAYKAYALWREKELQGQGLRRDQRIAQMRKEFEKRPENPMNQIGAGRYDMTKEEMKEHRDAVAAATEARLAQAE